MAREEGLPIANIRRVGTYGIHDVFFFYCFFFLDDKHPSISSRDKRESMDKRGHRYKERAGGKIKRGKKGVGKIAYNRCEL